MDMVKPTYTERLELRLTPGQKAKIERLAAIEGLNMSAIIREVVLGEKPKKLAGVRKEIKKELNGLGNNLNQIAKFLNTNNLFLIPLEPSEIKQLRSELQVAINNIEFMKAKIKQ